MEKKEFKTESKRLLDLMIHSIYTNKEIFLRELISNASDAIDKLYFKSLTDSNVGLKKDDFAIELKIDKDNRKLTISDNGIGMTKDELENNLGTIAKSGSLQFKKDNELGEDVDIIGQFGVGFYSAFMIADTVTVTTKAYGSDTAYRWVSSGADGYSIEEVSKESAGTEIVLDVKESTNDSDYDEFLEQYKIQSIVKKYSDYVRFPIKMNVESQKFKEGTEDEYETIIENKILNSMVPIWKKNKSELSQDDYNNFYKEKFMDYEPPLSYIHSKNEGTATYNALLYIPKKAPYDFFTKEFEKGLQLYSSGVMIMEKCSDLLPDHFSFVKGLVDSEDLSLNISREILQQDRQLKIIAKNIEKSIKNELNKMLKNEREKYEEFFNAFGLQLKFGIYNGYGAHKETLKDLIMFTSSFEKKLVTLSEYVSRMKDDQKYIYYASGESVAKIELLPQAEIVKEKGFEILYLTENVDEFAIQMMMEYDSKQFKSISSGDLDIETEEEKDELKKKSEENKGLFDEMKGFLGDKISDVRLTHRLKTHPVCLTSEGQLSVEMEKILQSMPNNQNVKADKILEINASHEIINKLRDLSENDKEKLEKYTKLLYSQALLIEGLSIEDPVELSNLICELMM